MKDVTINTAGPIWMRGVFKPGKTPRVRQERARCEWCGRTIATYVPAGGDGSVRLFRPHNDDGGPPKVPTPCPGSRREDPSW